MKRTGLILTLLASVLANSGTAAEDRNQVEAAKGHPNICRAGEVDVYLLGGQSNMQGCGAVADVGTKVPEVIPNAFFVHKQTIEPLTLGKTNNRGEKSFGPEIGFALEMASKERPVYIIKYAASGMPLHPGWSGRRWRGTEEIQPGVNFYPGLHSKDPNRGLHYKAMLTEFKDNIAFLKANGHTPVVRGFIWMQGEQDAKQQESAKVYATSLKNLRDRLSEDLGLGNEPLPMAFGQVVPNEPAPSRFIAIEAMHAQMAAADQDSGKPEAISNCKRVSTAGFRMKDDRVHFDAQGQLALGQAFAMAMKELNTKDASVSAQPPRKKKRVAAPAYDSSVPKPTLAEVRYGSHQRQVLDFWKAPSASADKPSPLVFYIHGGSWQTSSKEIINGCVDVNALLKAGVSVAAINYRYVSQAEAAGVVPPVKAPLHDAARALQFVRSKAGDWRIDKTRIGAAGASAGGCSALWLAYHDDMADPGSDDPIARESTRLFCAGVRVPQTSLDPQQMKEWLTKITYGGHAFGVKNKDFLDSRERLLPWIEAYSPYAHVSNDDPPVSMYYNKYLEKDLNAHSPQFGFNLQKRCKKVGLFCEVLYDRAPGYTQNEATFYLIKTLTAGHDGAE